MDLAALGWNQFFADQLAAYAKSGYQVGRIAAEDRHRFTVYTADGEIYAEPAGRLLHNAASVAALPKVGDWVVMSVLPTEHKAVVQGVLQRKTKFSRKAIGGDLDEQVLVANVDVLFIVQSLDLNFSVRRMERYLTMAHEGGVLPVIVLNKSDICDDVAARIAEIEAVAAGAPVLAISAQNDDLLPLRAFLKQGCTIAFVGSSGVGKSTIINRLAGSEVLPTGEVNEITSRGRHTTTRRELIILPTGELLIDTPGMRELQLWDAEEGLGETFPDIQALAASCRFSGFMPGSSRRTRK